MTIRIDILITEQTYGAYGERNGPVVQSHCGFAGDVREAGTGCYLLGERLYSPSLRRFLGPDASSPFGEGDINRYAYCSGDPVNRVDPGGDSWQTWIANRLGLSKATLSTAEVDGALAPPASDSISGHAQATTSPTIVASVGSSIIDVASPLTSLTSLATETQGAERAGGLYGWMSESASSDRGLRTKVGWGYTRTTYRSSDGALRVDSYAGRAALLKKAPGRLLGKFRAEWSAFPNTNGGTNYLADAEISGRDIRRLMRSVEKSGNTQPITILSGAHGNELGKNWKTGRRRYPEPLFYAGDLSSESEFASLAGRPDHSVKVTNLAKLSQADYLRLTDSNSIIVHGYCFGVADWPFMRKHNVSRATTYRV